MVARIASEYFMPSTHSSTPGRLRLNGIKMRANSQPPHFRNLMSNKNDYIDFSI
jgi:hypothetical protein